MSISPDKWQKTIKCIGVINEKNKEQYRTGCGKEFTATFFDLYRVTNWLDATLSFGSDYYIMTTCKHCNQPNRIDYSNLTHFEKNHDISILSNVDKRFIDKLPFKFKRFFSKY